MYLGFFASSGVLGGSALASWTGMNVDLAIIVVSAACMVLAMYGYRLIHQFERLVSVISGVGRVGRADPWGWRQGQRRVVHTRGALR
jgi:nucleobase:cation symporter-1, NCS1 family